MRRMMMDNSSLASNPHYSVFVSANAGTGKTRALTHRVFRLLLNGVSPDSILCVTYTKAAAVEMKERLQKTLATWAVCKESELLAELQEMSEPNPSQDKIQIARQLFASILDNENGPRIETIHSFCQSILSRFPIEAGVPPGFDLLTEAEANSLLQKNLQELFTTPIAEIQQKLKFLASITDERTLSEYLTQILQKRDIIDRFATDGTASARFKEHLKDIIGCKTLSEFTDDKAFLMQRVRQLPLKEIANCLYLGGKNDKQASAKINHWLSLSPRQAEAEFLCLTDVFFASGNPKSTLASKAVQKHEPEIKNYIADAQDQILAYMQAQSGAFTSELSHSICLLAANLYLSFQRQKFQYGVLDFDDLIFFTDQLLSKDQIQAWVRWKLETAIQHVLVDEAQDTSPTQWSVISHLVSEFFLSDEVEPLPRTLFAVGDYKQSIYSFQNANPDVFISKQSELAAQASLYNKPFKQVNLTKSYRSSAPILTFVDAVMQDPRITGVGDAYQPHQLHWASLSGMVELWPVITSQKLPPSEPFIPLEVNRVETAEVLLAEKIATHIKAFLDSGTDNILARDILPNDIMILVRKRDSFLANLRAALISARIPVSPPDRIILQNQIEIQDLLALAEVCLSPTDDMQLANMLKSPLLELDEKDLQELAIGRGSSSLFDRLIEYENADCQKAHACRKIIEWRARAGKQDVFHFFNQILIGDRVIDSFVKRLGVSVIESFNGFLQQILEFEKTGCLELSQFLKSFNDSKGILKRENSSVAYPQVSLLTIHGAKGLEAPIIYLPDMLNARSPSDTLTFSKNWVYWTENSQFSPAAITDIRTSDKIKQKREDDRLLYVALTRAKQVLIISGWEAPHRRFIKNSWYELLKDTISNHSSCQIEGDILRIIFNPNIEVKMVTQDTAVPVDSTDVPQWYDEMPEQHYDSKSRIIHPSEQVYDRQAVAPHKKGQIMALERGQIIHKLLEILPAIDLPKQADTAYRYIKRQLPKLSESEIENLYDETQAILNHQDCRDLFSQESLAEVPIMGRIGQLKISGQIDRLIVTDNFVKLADFKTGKPNADGNPPEAYIRQMALYVGLLEQIYPQRPIHAYIIWTQTAKLMPLLNSQLNTYLDSIRNA